MKNKKSNAVEEFGGTFGTLVLTTVLPLTTIYLNLACGKSSCSILTLPLMPTMEEMFNTTSLLIYTGWFFFQLIIHLLLPFGSIQYGLPLKNDKRLSYKCNGFSCFIFSVLAFVVAYIFGLPTSFVYKHYLSFIVSSIFFSFTLSLFLYIKSFSVPYDKLTDSVNVKGSFIYQHFLGRELNPRFGDFDLKFFCELRPGLIGWIILDFCILIEDFQKHNSLNYSLALVVFFHTFYVADALWHEEAILSTMDIVHDGLGLMLVMGNLSWVPFLYSLQARFLLEHPQIQWSFCALVAFFLLNLVGYAIFRLSNSQKNEFRKNPHNPSLSHLKTLRTSSGKKLLVSSWWGLSRHPNYMGDLIMALTWSLVTGFQHIIPYFYPIYFTYLLVHRGMRDDAHCRKKYGSDWDTYCDTVHYKIFPYIY
ncbi:hypothetical protein HELRODRAFT_187232 [Helobdella robusta]|uniref:Delta(14)-sterol reductase ERG24 n=1 Tax=Helobdella robusta TaxID=6412 RepID=T1FP80_HELRO|nr:hypothetical protein HELRODRAFT_187232 [Helobdella robusta]ESN99906.1 hypothetical protein HELRODRAFT_187232 [Helobdella robusta]